MVTGWALTVLLLGCPPKHAGIDLVYDGPERLVVDTLGPVQCPRVLLDDGTVPEAINWTVEPDGVARFEDGCLVAIAPGEVTVTGEYLGATTRFVVDVAVPLSLHFDNPPDSVAVGGQVPLLLLAQAGDEEIALVAVTWTSNDVQVLTVDAEGTVTGIAPGVAYVTAAVGRLEAMLELVVTASASPPSVPAPQTPE